MTTALKQLGQSRPSGTSAASIYSPASNVDAIIKTIFVTNVSSDIATYRLFHDDNGTTYSQDTAIAYDVELPPGRVDVYDMNIIMGDDTGNIAVRTDTANSITFTIYGIELS